MLTDSFEEESPDPILAIKAAFDRDTAKEKADLTIGVYRDEEGKPVVPKAVQIATQKVIETLSPTDYQYQTMTGDAEYCRATEKFLFQNRISDDSLLTIQTVSGTSALRIAADLARRLNLHVLIPTPTWGNHLNIFRGNCSEIPYLDDKGGFNLEAVLEGIKSQKQALILFQSGAHNPTGVTPTADDWDQIAALCKLQDHRVLLDNAYQGFHTEASLLDPQESLVAMERHQVPLMLTLTYSKIFGMYGFRMGSLTLTIDPKEREILRPILQKIIRSNYSSPPRFGARIVKTVLEDPELLKSLTAENLEMKKRIQGLRLELTDKLKHIIPEHDWSPLEKQTGFFAYLGLSRDVVEKVIKNDHIYFLLNSRVNLASLNTDLIERFVKAIRVAMIDE